MKKILLIFIAAALALSVAAGAVSGILTERAKSAEESRIANIMGAVSESYPEAENTFIEAMADENRIYEKQGRAVLASYGYDGEDTDGSDYDRAFLSWIGVSAAMFTVMFAFGAAIYFLMKRKQEQKNQLLISVLEDCLSENFQFTADDDELREAGDIRFAESIRQLEETLRLKTVKYNEEHDNTKTLVTDISHQLKTPISAMKVCFDMYLGAETAEEKEEFLTRSMIQMDKLESLAASLINISRLENNVITLRPEEVYLTDMLIGAVNTEYHKAAKKDIDIETEEFEDIRLMLDKKWTVEAIANIIDNAVKYSPEHSRINIRVNKLFSFVRIEIEDFGIGIPKEERNKIFARFFRGSSDAVKEQEGSGVGLYLTRKILEDQGGTVSVKSKQEAGSVFTVQLPL